MKELVVDARRTIEALRAGVPNRHAVKRLGTTQEAVQERFDACIDAAKAGDATAPIVLTAGFGQGKSHLLECLQARAEDEGFVTSYVSVSPEMPLGNPHVVLEAIAETARAPEHEGKALRELAAGSRSDSGGYAEVRRWATDAQLPERFLALLHLYEELRLDEEFRVRILEDIEGRPLRVQDIRRNLREIGQAGSYDVASIRSAGLAHPRLQVYARLCRAWTGRGLVVLFDEVERLRSFSRRQRFLAYQELGWWAEAAATPGSGVVAVFAATSDSIDNTVVHGYEDETRLRTLPPDVDRDQLELMRVGIKLLKSALGLRPISAAQETDIQYRAKRLYEEAYGGEVPACGPPHGGRLSSTPIRSEIRRWITHWDLFRYDPSYQVEVAVGVLDEDTAETPDGLLADGESESG